jgi:hypothetical protein
MASLKTGKNKLVLVPGKIIELSLVDFPTNHV